MPRPAKRKSERSIEGIFGEVLRHIRNERGLSQEALAFTSGYHRTYIGQLERGEKSPSLRTLFNLCEALLVQPADLVASVSKQYSKR